MQYKDLRRSDLFVAIPFMQVQTSNAYILNAVRKVLISGVTLKITTLSSPINLFPNAVGMTDPVTPGFNPAVGTPHLTPSAVGTGGNQPVTLIPSRGAEGVTRSYLWHSGKSPAPFPWVETHGYQIGRADGTVRETLLLRNLTER
jgi:hypothetical protein